MSVVALKPDLGLFSGFNVPVAGDIGQESSEETFNQIAKFKSERTNSSGVFYDLEQLAQEVGLSFEEDNAFILAKRFLLALPSQLPLPELAYDEDGEIEFDWCGGKGRYVSLTLRDDGRIAYAARFSEVDKDTGTKRFENSIPKQVIEMVQKLFKV